jgi:hypothetical protein
MKLRYRVGFDLHEISAYPVVKKQARATEYVETGWTERNRQAGSIRW